MDPQCEIIGKYVLPIYRSLLAKELVQKYHLSQTETAKKLGTTQAAISQYLSSKRAYKGMQQVEEFMPKLQLMAQDTAKKLANKEIEAEEIINEEKTIDIPLQTQSKPAPVIPPKKPDTKPVEKTINPVIIEENKNEKKIKPEEKEEPQKVLKTQEEIDSKVFTYHGPEPFSKETAVLMMADVVEAASRSLKKPDEESISILVENMIDKQMENHQFDNADITLRDIRKIKKIFKKKLMNIYHLRIEYPE